MLLHTTTWHDDALGIPWLMLHGFTGDGEDFQLVIDTLGGALSAPVIAVDLIGHGRSPAPDDLTAYTMESCVGHIVETLDDLGVERVHALGYSMGGRTALHLARRHPHRVASLACIGATPGLAEEDAVRARVEADHALAMRIREEGVEAFLEFWGKVPVIATQSRIPSEYASRMRARRSTRSETGLALSLEGMGTGAMPSLWGELGRMAHRTWLAVGQEDQKFRGIAHRMVELMPSARVAVVEGAGHAAHLERPAAFARALSVWKREAAAL